MSTLLSLIVVLKSYMVSANSLKELKAKYGFVTDRQTICLLSLRFHLTSDWWLHNKIIEMSK